MIQQFHSWVSISLKKTNTLIRKNTCTPMFIAAFFIIAKIWKIPKCPWIDEWIKKMWYIHMCIYISIYVCVCIYIYIYIYSMYIIYIYIQQNTTQSLKKEWNFAICSNMDRPGGYCAKWNKSDRERQILYVITYM